MQGENEDFDMERYAAETFDPEILSEIRQIMLNKEGFKEFLNDLNAKIAAIKLEKINLESQKEDEEKTADSPTEHI